MTSDKKVFEERMFLSDDKTALESVYAAVTRSLWTRDGKADHWVLGQLDLADYNRVSIDFSASSMPEYLKVLKKARRLQAIVDKFVTALEEAGVGGVGRNKPDKEENAKKRTKKS